MWNQEETIKNGLKVSVIFHIQRILKYHFIISVENVQQYCDLDIHK